MEVWIAVQKYHAIWHNIMLQWKLLSDNYVQKLTSRKCSYIKQTIHYSCML